MTTVRSRFVKLLLITLALICSAPGAAGDSETQTCADDPLNVGFYSFFNPVSYSEDEDPESEGFDTHRGYEADLLTALEAMEGAGLSFIRKAIPVWDEIWLLSATSRFDLVGGGITILESRRRDADGDERITFTSGHITFRQSLLARAEDAKRLDSYVKLASDVRVGVVANTTGEGRLLVVTGYVDEAGLLAPGVGIDTPQGILIADGSDDYVITPAGETPNLTERTALLPPLETMPQVIYLSGELGSGDLIEALREGEIDAIARGFIGNFAAAHASDGALVVSVVDDEIETGGFTVAVEDEQLAACLDDKIDWLTDDGRIAYQEWVADPAVFMGRAQMWNERQEQE